ARTSLQCSLARRLCGVVVTCQSCSRVDPRRDIQVFTQRKLGSGIIAFDTQGRRQQAKYRRTRGKQLGVTHLSRGGSAKAGQWRCKLEQQPVHGGHSPAFPLPSSRPRATKSMNCRNRGRASGSTPWSRSEASASVALKCSRRPSKPYTSSNFFTRLRRHSTARAIMSTSEVSTGLRKAAVSW